MMAKKNVKNMRKQVAKALRIDLDETNMNEETIAEIDQGCKIAYFNQTSKQGVEGIDQQWSNKAILAVKAGYSYKMEIKEGSKGSLASKIKITTAPNFDAVFKILQFNK